MTAWDWAVVIAVGLLLIIAADCCRDSDYRDAWQESTRTEDDVRADATAWRKQRFQPAVDTEPGDPYSDDRIDLERMFIPTQRTPRTEDNQ
ncbi:hypothetical protein [Streptomyces erythrochromogenes]|uniref:hypothetical protein n=1 Tax=Streptomyces erythrochromogenes TaxID=285574 RepID=UPI002257E514|nr:hypothetical protein [Streptomyces erythrochromogenes]MCX5584233.1 hypothetical protein [Streptomyces erythrochromogenes]